MEKNPQLPTPSSKLVEANRAGRTVLVVASGVSCVAGGPTWREMLHGLAADAQEQQPDALSRKAEALQPSTTNPHSKTLVAK